MFGGRSLVVRLLLSTPDISTPQKTSAVGAYSSLLSFSGI